MTYFCLSNLLYLTSPEKDNEEEERSGNGTIRDPAKESVWCPRRLAWGCQRDSCRTFVYFLNLHASFCCTFSEWILEICVSFEVTRILNFFGESHFSPKAMNSLKYCRNASHHCSSLPRPYLPSLLPVYVQKYVNFLTLTRLAHRDGEFYSFEQASYSF